MNIKQVAFGFSVMATLSVMGANNKRPNVIFILMDDAGYGDFGCYGQKKTETPNIDALCQKGIKFTDMYCSAPLSSPSRCGLLTGRNSGHAQIRANDDWYVSTVLPTHHEMLNDSSLEGQRPMLAGTETLGSMMKSVGYHTAMIGKWGLGTPTSPSTPNKLGFDTFYGIICQRMAHNYYPPFLWDNDRREYLDNTWVEPGTMLKAGVDPNDPRSYSDYIGSIYSPDKMYEHVISYVNDHHDEPFFLMWTTPLPHSPMQAPQRWVDYYVKKFGDEKPIAGKGYYPSRYPRATYAAMISCFDEQVGGLVKELKRLGIYDDTLIIITSDNGPANNSCSSTEWFDSAQPFRCGKNWGKSSLREGGIRMPFIVSYGNKITPGTSNHIGYFPDIMPTLCELTGTTPPPTDGISILPTILGGKQKEHEYLYWEFPGSKGWIAVREGNWKGLLRNVSGGNKEVELYNLEKDPREQHNVASKHPEIIERMWNFIENSHVPSEVSLFDQDVPLH